MKIIPALVVVLLSGCATSRQMQGPSGGVAYFIKCGSAVIDACYEEAARFVRRVTRSPTGRLVPTGWLSPSERLLLSSVDLTLCWSSVSSSAMCGRYKLEEHWQEYCKAAQFDRQDPPWPTPNPLKGSEEARPTDPMPIIRRNENGHLFPELRRWGFIMMVPGKTIDKATGEPKTVRRDVINAMSEKLTSSYMWKWAFKERRCLIPMSSWDEWPETGAGKQRVRVSMPSEPVFLAAGLYDENVNPKTGEKVSVFTMCTVPPNEFLGTVHDRAPMVLLPDQYEGWLDGGPSALRLVGVHPDVDAFDVKPV